MKIPATLARLCCGMPAVLVMFVAGAAAQEISDGEIVERLRAGGHVIYFRHAPTNWSQNDQVREAGDWRSCDGNSMRQLSDQGRNMARRIGRAMRALHIPIAQILSSEYCRSAETARLLGLGPVETTTDIMNMRAADFVGGDDAVVRRARRVLATPPPVGGNTVVVGHGNLMRAATGAYAGEAGSGIYVPDPLADKGFRLIAELEPGGWSRLADLFPPGG